MVPQTRSPSQNNSRLLTFIEGKRHPFWSFPLMSYLISLPLVGLCILAIELESYFMPNFSYPGGLLYLAVALSAFIGGLGPALFTICLSALTLDYFFLPSQYEFTVRAWSGVVQMLRFVVIGLLIASLIVQLRTALRRATTAEYEQHKRASQLEAVFEAITDSVIVYDEQGKILSSNRAAHDLFPLTNEPTFGADSLAELGDLSLAVCDEYGVPLAEEQLPARRVLRGEVLTGEDATDILVRGAADGQLVQVSITGAPICTADGQLTGAVVVMRDVTMRRQLEQRTHQTLSTLLAMAGTLVYGDTAEAQQSVVTTADEVIARLAELAQHALGFQHVSILLPDATGVLQPVVFVGFSAEQEEHVRTAALSFRASEAYAQAVTCLRKDGVVFLDTTRPPFEALHKVGLYTPMLVPMVLGEQLVGILALNHSKTNHDYSPDEIALAQATARFIALVIDRQRLVRERTEARANELSLREAQRQMEAFLGIAGHELKTPLTSIKGNIQLADLKLSKLLSQPGLTSEEITAALAALRLIFRRADRQGELLNRLVNDLVDVSRIQTNKLHLRLTRCDLAAIVLAAVEEQRQIATSRSIGLHLPEESMLVLADADRIGQVVTNYLTNALKYSKPACAIEVYLTADENTVRVEVCDEGPGLFPEEQERIWERFYQAEGVEVQSGSSIGLGIGLHVCHTIIAQHDGKIGVQSAPGQGSTFWFTLSRLEAELSLPSLGHTVSHSPTISTFNAK